MTTKSTASKMDIAEVCLRESAKKKIKLDVYDTHQKKSVTTYFLNFWTISTIKEKFLTYTFWQD